MKYGRRRGWGQGFTLSSRLPTAVYPPILEKRKIAETIFSTRNRVTTALAEQAKATLGPTLTELHERFGDLPAWRIRIRPFPATEDDVVEIYEREKRFFELVDGFLVEKPVGCQEGFVAATIIGILQVFVKPRKTGFVFAPDTMMKILPSVVYYPDVAFVKREQLPHGVGPTPAPEIHPNLAVEVLSVSNTAREMKEKRRNYFESGTEVVWIVDPVAKTVAVHFPSDPEKPCVFTDQDVLDGEPVLPGFSVPVATIFEDVAP
jgi:Uma2 family endonuclease